MPGMTQVEATQSGRTLVEILALGITNGLLLGVGITIGNTGLGLLLAFTAGTGLSLSYLFAKRWN